MRSPRIRTHTPMRPRLLLAALASVTLSGCGTLWTRCMNDTPVVGGYPFEAVVIDVWGIGDSLDRAFSAESRQDPHAHHDAEFWMFLLSLPVDLALDAVLTPVDLVAWAFGATKGG